MQEFKNFVLNNTLEDVANYCAAKAVELGCDESEIGDKALDAVGTFYCPDDALAARFGFMTEAGLSADCQEIALGSGVRAGDVVDALHQLHSVSRFNEGFYGGQIVFVDLKALAARFSAVADIDDGLVEVPY